MISINKLISTIFLIFFLLVFTPTLIFLIRSYYGNIMTKKTYIGVIELPSHIERSEDVINSAKALFSSADIRAIILKCNSHGGKEGPCQAIYYDILKLKKIHKKPIVAYIESECFSGAYFIATSTDSIISSPGALIGYFGIFDFNNFKKQNLYQNINQGQNKIIEDDLEKNFKKQYFDIINNFKKDINLNFIKTLEKTCVNGEIAFNNAILDNLGGILTVENALKKMTVIEGNIQEVRGSITEHFISYLTGMINKIIKN